MKKFFKPAILALSLVAMTACSNDDDTPEQINEEEEITDVVLTLTETGTTNVTTYELNEGNGFTGSITIDAGVSYESSIEFLDLSDPSAPEDITEEVIEEADEHQVFYDNSVGTLTINSANDDVLDSAGAPVGINTVWNAEGSTQGNLVIYLIHEPVTKSGETRDDFGGETDVEVSISVVVN